MAKAAAKHVVAHEDGWVIKSEGHVVRKSAQVFKTKREAVVKARAIAKEKGVDLVIHRRDGKIQDVDSYRRKPVVSELIPRQ